MRIIDTTSTALPPTVQEIAEQLGVSLNRPVTITDGSGVSIQGDDSTQGRVIMSGVHFEVPVQDQGAVVAYIVVQVNGGSPLSPMDFETLDAASALVRDLLREKRGTDRESVLHDLLDDDESVRRNAYARALHHRWLHRERGTVVRALLIDAAVSNVQSIAFARHLAHMRPVPSHFMGLHAGMVMLAGQPSEHSTEERILQEASTRGIRILGIGSASPSRGEGDLRSAASEATIAASLAAALPQFHPAVDASELGGWLLLASASANPAHLHVISPAAHALYSHGDGSQRQTVETYLDVGANVVAACEILFVHRTTLYYRLERMPEVVRDALNDGMKRSTLHVALKLIRLWEATGRV